MFFKNTFIVFLQFLFIAITCSAQTQPYDYNLQVNYKMTYQPDSTDEKSNKTEVMSLLIGKEQSLFAAHRYLMMDSAHVSEVAKGNKWGPPMAFFNQFGTRYQQVIFKENKNIYVYEPVARFIPVVWIYDEPKSVFEWNIQSDTLTIAGYKCQKAELVFGNRKWTAWFTPEIPIYDGPYKFSGLPGLILKMNDSQQYWNFDIMGIEHINKKIKLTFADKKTQKAKNKISFFEQKKYSRDNQFELRKISGTKFSDDETFKQMYEKEGIADNNWIELYKP